MSLLLLLPGAGAAGPPPPPQLSGVAPVDTPVVWRGHIQQTGIKEELEIERRIMLLDDEDIAEILTLVL